MPPGGPLVVPDPRYRMLADVVITRLNTLADAENEAGICIEAVHGIADYVGSLPCVCVPGYESVDGCCGRCRVPGRWHDKPMGR